MSTALIADNDGQNRGFFCCNTRKPEKYIEAGFITGPVRRTKYFSAERIESDGYVGIYTKLEDIDGPDRYRRMSGLRIPDKHSELFPGLDYEVKDIRK